MRTLNLNQKKAISELLVNLSAAFISISTVGALISGIRFNSNMLTIIFTIIIISLLLINLSVYILKK